MTYPLCGGTDGGNKVILRNAEHLTGLAGEFSVVVAGNKATAKEAAEILEASGKLGVRRLCENIMPQYNCLNVDPAQAAIRNLFRKKLSRQRDSRGPEIYQLGSSPATYALRAVLQGLELLARGTAHQAGLEIFWFVDGGSAYTDVYSMVRGTCQQVVLRGLREPYAKRTL